MDESAAAGMIERRLLNGIQAALLMVAMAVHFGLTSVPGGSQRDEAGAEVVAYVLLALLGVAGAWFVVRRRPLPVVVKAVGVAVLLFASVLVAATLPPEPVLRVENWSFGVIGWYGLFLLCTARVRVIALFLGVHVAVSLGEVLLAGAPATALAQMAITAVSVAGFQLGIGMGATFVRRIATAASAAARAEEAVRTEEAVAELVHRDHEQRYARLLETTVPLLAGLAAGTLDQSTVDVRRRCAVEAARMRRLFAENEDSADPLVHELAAGIDVAERLGVSVQLAIRGESGPLTPQVRRELLEPVSEVLAAARSSARVTVLRGPQGVRVSVVCEVEQEPPPGPPPRQVRLNRTKNGSSLWMEALWQPGS